MNPQLQSTTPICSGFDHDHDNFCAGEYYEAMNIEAARQLAISPQLLLTTNSRHVAMPIFCRCLVYTVSDRYETCPQCVIKAANNAKITNDFTRRRITIVGIVLAIGLLVVAAFAAIQGV